MKKSLLLIAFLIILTIPSAFAFTTFSEEIQIHSDLTTTFIIEATTQSTDQIQFTLPLLFNIDQIQIDDVNTLNTCEVQDSSDQTSIACQVEEGLHSVFVKGESSYPIILSEENYFFTLNQDIEADSISVKITLPENSEISEERSIGPEPSNQFHVGSSQVLLWRFEEPTSVSISFLASNPQNGLIWKILIPIILLITALMVWIIKHKKSQKKNSKQESITSNLDHLLENEKKVVGALKEAKNNKKDFLWQKELQIATGLSKVQLSRTLRRMLERRLLNKEPHGASNKISIKSVEHKE